MRFAPALILLLAACGGGGEDSAVSSSAPAPVDAHAVQIPSEAPAATPQPVSPPPSASAPVQPAPSPQPAPIPAPVPPQPAPQPTTTAPAAPAAPSPVVEPPPAPRPAVQTVDMTCVIRGLYQRIQFRVTGPGEPWSTLTVHPLTGSYYQSTLDHWGRTGSDGDWEAFWQDPDGKLVSSGQYRIEGDTVYLNQVELYPPSDGPSVTTWLTKYTFRDGQLVSASATIMLSFYDRAELTCPAEGGPPNWDAS